MKKSISVILYVICISALFLAAAGPAFAQAKQLVPSVTQRVIRQEAAQAQNAAKSASFKYTPHYLKNSQAEQAAQAAEAAFIGSRLPAPAIERAVKKSLLAEETKRGIQKMAFSVLRKLGFSARASWEMINTVSGITPRRAAAALTGEKYILKEFELHTITLGEEIPSYPIKGNRIYMYRGMALTSDGKSLHNIFNNGMLLKDVRSTNNQLLLSYAGPRGGSLAASTKVICFTNDPSCASDYALQRANDDHLLPVVVHVRGVYNGRLVMHGTDVSPDQIARISVLLKVKGKPTWGVLEKLEDGRFSFKPYAQD